MIKKINKKKILRNQREEKDFYDKYEGVSIYSSSNESNFNKYSFKEQDLMVEVDKKDNIQKKLGEENEKVWLEPEKQNFKPI